MQERIRDILALLLIDDDEGEILVAYSLAGDRAGAGADPDRAICKSPMDTLLLGHARQAQQSRHSDAAIRKALAEALEMLAGRRRIAAVVP